MSTEQARIEELFAEAVAKTDAAVRADFLAQACGDDRALRERVEALLAAHEAAGTFLPLPEFDGVTAPFAPLSERPGTTIGRYKLLEQIGEGGFGVVFMAEQEEPVRRRVALKIIKAGMDTKQVVARFEAERQALAMMDHPNIARVLDAGATDTGRPYFVMELVKGIPITQYCDQQKLTTDERLKLFMAVCSAVQHAHQKGIIHRDLKPSNVMVTLHDDKPVPKIIDFGIAKATQARLTEKTLFTEFRQLIGTPAYMSPEQAQMIGLDVDTRSDIYSLGVLLYELLTGTTPFDSKELVRSGYDEMRRIIREVEPPRPSTRFSQMTHPLSRSLPSVGRAGEGGGSDSATIAANRGVDPKHLSQQLRGELDWIVMKCLEKDRTRRYESAGSLARDVERYLHDEPVQACPPSVVYQVSKLIRRNRVIFLAASSIVMTLVIASAISMWLYLREREARRQAEFGSAIFNIVNPFSNNSPEVEDQSLASLASLVTQMDSQNQAEFYCRLADLRGRQGWWKESAEYFAKGLHLEPNQLGFEPWHKYLPVLIQSGDLGGYHRARHELIRRFAGTTDVHIADCVLKDCLFTPLPSADFDQLERLADTVVQPADDHWWEYFQFAKGLLEYRRANYEEALVCTRRATTSTSDPYLIVPAHMVRAMAHHQLGETEEAQKVLSSGLEFAHLTLRREAKLSFDKLWQDWIIANALMDEASALVDPRRRAEIPKWLATYHHPTFAIDNLYFLALEKLRADDERGYHEACKVLALVPESNATTSAEFRRIWTWCVGPHPADELTATLKHAELVAANHSLDAGYLENLVLGGVLFRLGQHEAAAQHLEASLAAYPARPSYGLGTSAYPQLLLSMVKSQLGELDQARRLLAEIRPAIDQALETPSTLWEYRAVLEVLRREAEALIGQDQTDAATDRVGSPPATPADSESQSAPAYPAPRP